MLQEVESTDSKSETLESLSDKGRSSLTVLVAVFSLSSRSTRSSVLHDTLFGKTETGLMFESLADEGRSSVTMFVAVL